MTVPSNASIGISQPLVCVPGQRLCLSDENTVAGQGTYERQGYIYSQLAGIVNVVQKDDHASLPIYLLSLLL